MIPKSAATGSPTVRDIVEREFALVDTFVALADTLVDDYDIVEFLDRLAHSCVSLLGATAAGLLLFDGARLALVASSSERAEHLEVFQVQADEGPCLDCARTSQAISVPDLRAVDDRWPTFKIAAAEAGFQAVHAVPLRLRSQAVGGLNMFSEKAAVWSPQDLHVAQALADVATIGILQQRAILQAGQVTEQLQAALNGRVVIEQAKGMVAEHGGIDMATAFSRLRRYARDHNLKMGDLAREIVEGRIGRDVVSRVSP